MAQKIVAAGLGTRNLLSQPLHFHRLWLFSPRIEIAAVRFPKKFAGGSRVLVATSGSRLPVVTHCRSSSYDDDANPSKNDVLLSTKDLPDGSILYRFGSPEQKLKESVAECETTSKDGSTMHDQIIGTSMDTHSSLYLSKDPTVSGIQSETMTNEAAPDPTATIQNEDSSINVEKPASCLLESDIMKVQESNTRVDTTDSPGGKKSPEKKVVAKEKGKGVLKLHSGAAMLPHPSKATSGGEDAYFIEGTSWVGVADGVGGWSLSGINAGLYSRELMSKCSMLAKMEEGITDPKSVIIKAVKKCTAIGTCTAIVAALYGQTLYIANIGDSGFLLVRNGNVFSKSHPMQRAFNFPYQIGTEGDDPSMAETFEVKVDSGDVLVLATDGVFDNLFEEKIVDLVQGGLAEESKPEEVAVRIVQDAHCVGKSSTVRSPFSVAAEAAGYEYTGGKLDDATVVVSYVE